jgi:transposase-like protein
MRRLTPEQEEYREQMKVRASTLQCGYEDCENHNNVGPGNIIFIRKYGMGATQNLFKCNRCKRTFSERKGIALYGCRLPEEKVTEVTKCLSEGTGIRATARITGVSKNTVCSMSKRIGSHMEKVTESTLQNCHVNEVQLDELCGIIFKKRRI